MKYQVGDEVVFLHIPEVPAPLPHFNGRSGIISSYTFPEYFVMFEGEEDNIVCEERELLPVEDKEE